LHNLAVTKNRCDGAHCGLGDWYPDVEASIVEALEQGPEHEWTTDWYSSKKEIASARISHRADLEGGGLCIEVTVSDDFDTPGHGAKIIRHTTDLEEVREAIYAAWDEAETNQKGNRLYVGWSVLHQEDIRWGPDSLRKNPPKSWQWIETYIAPQGEALYYDFESPPGDNYHKWGWENDWPEEGYESPVPADVREKFEEYINGDHGDVPRVEYKGYILQKWDD
jgi:hypothetical protein